MLETFLILVKYIYGMMFLLGDTLNIPPVVIAFKDLNIDGAYISIPFFLMASISLFGLWANATGYEWSKYFRIFGATLGMTMWLFIILNDCRMGVYFAGVHPWMTIAILGSMWIIRRGVKGLPRPGAAGLV